MKVERYPTAEEVAVRAADLVAAVLAEKPAAALVLPAGGTPLRLYAELVRRHGAGAIDLGRAHLFQLDELIGLSAGDERSFRSFLTHHLIDSIEAGSERTHLLDGGVSDPGAEIARHARTLAERGGADLVLLGIGRNGHVAFNEPGSTRDLGARVTDLAASTVSATAKSFTNGDGPTTGMTLGLREILASERIALLATGSAKAEILAATLASTPTSERPASLLRDHPGFSVLADEAAARLLPASL